MAQTMRRIFADRGSLARQMLISVVGLTLFHSTVFGHAGEKEIDLTVGGAGWQSLRYSGIPSNQLQQTDKGIRIEIDGSASPLIYVFRQPTLISAVDVQGMLSALPHIPEGKRQGAPGADDFGFRLGLVIAGNKTLNFAQRLIAADWVKTLYGLAPGESGIDRVEFLNLSNSPGPEWKTRVHPQSRGLFEERVVQKLSAPGPFRLAYKLPKALPVIAFWISSDGDDTQSRYRVDLTRLVYSGL